MNDHIDDVDVDLDIDADIDGPDAIADGDHDVTSTSSQAITRELERGKAQKKAVARKEWKTKPVKAFFKRVAAPSAAMGTGAYLLSVAHGEPSPWLAAAAGAAYFPTSTAAEPVSRWAGKLHGHLSNMFNRNQYFQQIAKEIEYESWARGFLMASLLSSAVMGPTYVKVLGDTAEAIGDGVSFVATRLYYGITNYEKPSSTPVEAPEAAPEQPETPLPSTEDGVSGRFETSDGKQVSWNRDTLTVKPAPVMG